MKYLLMAFTILLVGCSTKDPQYYKAIENQNKMYQDSYKSVKNGGIVFDGTFKGKMSITQPKKLPQFAQIKQRKSNSDVALSWGRLLIPMAGMITGSYFNYKALDSSNKYNAENISNWTGNYKNDSTTTSVENTTNTSTDKSVENTTNTQTNQVPTITDGNISIGN